MYISIHNRNEWGQRAYIRSLMGPHGAEDIIVRPNLTSLGLVESVHGHHPTKLIGQDQHFSDLPLCCVNCWYLSWS